MIKEVHYAGYSTEPSDYECPDGQLATSINLISEDNQLKPVFQPAEKFALNIALNTGEQLLWIHKMNGHTHYILLVTTTSNNETTRTLYWTCTQVDASNSWQRHRIGTVSDTPTVSSIGNTLVVNVGTISYYLWKAESSEYKELGQKPPMLEITFGLHSDFAVWPDKKNTSGAKNGYNGAFVDIGRVNNTGSGFPMLGEYGTSLQWAGPKPEMAADNASGDDHARIKKFGEEQATFSVENFDNSSADKENDMVMVKNRLTQGVFAHVNRFVNEKGTKENKFVMPFFIRYAYRLYDDTYIMHSYPVLMIPNSRGPVFGLDGKMGLMLGDMNNNTIGVQLRGRVYGFLCDLVMSISSVPPGLSDWSDIVQGVTIGVSAPCYTYDQAGDVFGWTSMDGDSTTSTLDESAWSEYYSLSKVMTYTGLDISSTSEWGSGNTSTPSWGVKPFVSVFKDFCDKTRVLNSSNVYQYGQYFNHYTGSSLAYKYPSYIATVPQRDISEINNSLTGATNFYIIKEYEIGELAQCTEKSLDLEKGTLNGLMARNRIDDDYRTHDELSASLMHNYNGRMNFAGVERTVHSPINPTIQLPYSPDLSGTDSFTIAVEVQNDNGNGKVKVCSVDGRRIVEFPRWLYYPDANAKTMWVKINSTVYKLKLTPHDHLNGAYWLGDIMKQDVTGTLTESQESFPTASTSAKVPELNKLYTSNADNPFFFAYENIKSIGTGKILGISAAAKALSPGQFGKFPLYAFTDEGVWALEVTKDGTFLPSQPITRDVCSNPDSITQIDSAVLFVTDRGIMIISGSEAQCISDNIFAEHPFDVRDLPGLEQLHTKLGHGADACLPVKSFLGFLRDCQMVYDYVHQHIIVFNPTTTTSNGVTTDNYTYAYVYSLKSKQWGMMYSNLDYNVNSYPDALAVTKANKLVSFSSTDETTSKGLFVTRPLKLEAPDIYKTINSLIQRGHFERNDVGTVLYGSRDLYTWRLVWSSKDHYLRGFRGTPYKYFRIAGLTSLTDGKSVFGASVNMEPRHLNNLL